MIRSAPNFKLWLSGPNKTKLLDIKTTFDGAQPPLKYDLKIFRMEYLNNH